MRYMMTMLRLMSLSQVANENAEFETSDDDDVDDEFDDDAYDD